MIYTLSVQMVSSFEHVILLFLGLCSLGCLRTGVRRVTPDPKARHQHSPVFLKDPGCSVSGVSVGPPRSLLQ